MRSIITESFIYIFNPWSDGERKYGNNNEGRTMAAMLEEARTDPEIAMRCELFRKRVEEELYDMQNDPEGLHNLIDKPDYAKVHNMMAKKMRKLMIESQDPVLEIFDHRYNPEKLLKSFYKVYPGAIKADKDKAYYSLKSASY